MRHLIDFGDLPRHEWDALYARASQIMDDPSQFVDAVSYTHLTLPTIEPV